LTEGASIQSPLSGPLGGLRRGDHVYLIDGSGYIFRAYHALPPLIRKSDGLPTGAVAGFCNMLWKLLEDTKSGDKPTHLAVIFDTGRKSFRNDIFPEYKANRTAPPEDLVPQFPLVRDATRAFGAACVEREGYEADDLIATYARDAREQGALVTIVSSDKDLMQLVHDGEVTLLDPVKNKRIGSAEVIERFGVPPEKVIAVQALAGDSTDNVPGVPGIGVKTAAELINAYGDLETLLARAAEIKQPKRRETLMANADKARISEKLVRLDDHVPDAPPMAEFAVRDPNPDELLPFLNRMEFATLARRVMAKLGGELALPETPAKAPAPSSAPEQDDIEAAQDSGAGGMPGEVLDRALWLKTLDPDRYETVSDLAALERWITRGYEVGEIAIDTEATSPDALAASLCGVSLAIGPNEACYIPVGHRQHDLLDERNQSGTAQLSEAVVLERLKPLLENESVLKIGQNLKYEYLILLKRGIRIAPFDDTMLMSYVLDAGLHGHGVDELSDLYLSHTPMALENICGRGKEMITFDRVALIDATRYAAEDADVVLRLQKFLRARLVADHRLSVYETLERPLVPVLAEMEFAGITIDPQELSRLSHNFAQKMAALEHEIHGLAGEAFNLGSPKQLGDILFGKFSLPGGKRTKTGAWSTDANALEELAAQGHELPNRILAWRGLAKLKSTYTDSLPSHINATTGRVHTSFALAATTTGRLSSTEPNLQNIPIRTEEGRQIRRAFVAAKGMKLISADYSQIELRLLAHIADVPALVSAFAAGIDIHAATASEIFGVPVKEMPAEVRRRAKAINFGIVYGISAFGLANQLGIPRGEADAYIKKYFQRFPGIRDYMEHTRRFAREHGYVDTIFGRRIHIRDIKTASAAQRAFAERQAINAPIQGSAADVIRRAMIRLPNALANAGLQARLLLQVHDELVMESPSEQADQVCALAQKVMAQAAHPAITLKVPLEVEARAGANWDEAH
jgi:DNA polymerase-1